VCVCEERWEVGGEGRAGEFVCALWDGRVWDWVDGGSCTGLVV
jgi:hypothetical protein